MEPAVSPAEDACCWVMLDHCSHEVSVDQQRETGASAALRCPRMRPDGLHACAFGREGTVSDLIWRSAGQQEASCDVHLISKLTESSLQRLVMQARLMNECVSLFLSYRNRCLDKLAHGSNDEVIPRCWLVRIILHVLHQDPVSISDNQTSRHDPSEQMLSTISIL